MNQQSPPGPQTCVKCHSADFHKENLTFCAKRWMLGRGYRFTVYICRNCGYTEHYLLNQKIWV